jgi:hypothetical protein
MYDLVRGSLFGSEAPSVAEAARDNVTAYERTCRAPFGQAAVATLLAALAPPDAHSTRQ